MKRIVSMLVSIALLSAFCLPCFATSADEMYPVVIDIEITEEEFNLLEHSDGIYKPTPSKATGLIVDRYIRIAKSGSNLIISGYTQGNLDVTKAGFTIITVERRATSGSSWSTYTSFSDLYSDSSTYVCDKAVSVTSGYQYRVTCTHYASVPFLIFFSRSEEIDASTGYLTF